MTEWLSLLVGLSFAGSGVLCFSLFLTYVTKATFTAKWHYWNRKLSLFFFLIPAFLIPDLFFVFKNERTSIELMGQSMVHQNTIILTETFIQVILIVWITGVLTASLWCLYLYRQWMKHLQANCIPVPKESAAHQLLHKHMEKMNIRSSIKIVFCRMNISPFICGIFKPVIVLPMYDIPYHELDLIIKHELTHYKKKDLWIKRAMLLAKVLHWYNPLIYILQKEINKWSEISCDEDVVINMSHVERKTYGEAILNMMYQSNQDTNSYLLGAFFSTGQTNLKQRLTKMLEVKKVSKSIVALSAAILFTIGGVMMASADVAHANISTISEELFPKVDNDKTEDVLGDEAQEEKGGYYEITSVKKSDESKFSKEDWEEILKQVENNEIILEEE